MAAYLLQEFPPRPLVRRDDPADPLFKSSTERFVRVVCHESYGSYIIAGTMAIITDDTTDWNVVDAVACSSRPTHGVKNKQATCANCGICVFYSWKIPADVPTVCETCAVEFAGACE